MRFQINTTEKLVTLLEPCNIIELVTWLEKAFGEEYKEYKIYSETYNYVGYYPWYYYKWYEPIVSPTTTDHIYNIAIS